MAVVELLQGLFNQLIHAPVAAVTPQTELAYLALVPSKDEATVPKQAAAPTTTMESDAALTAPLVSPSREKQPTSPSILGKRRNDALSPSGDLMALDEKSPARATAPEDDIIVGYGASSPLADDDRLSKRGKSVDDEDIAMASSIATTPAENAPVAEDKLPSPMLGPPPLPPRPDPKPSGDEKDLVKQVSDYMAFGEGRHVAFPAAKPSLTFFPLSQDARTM